MSATRPASWWAYRYDTGLLVGSGVPASANAAATTLAAIPPLPLATQPPCSKYTTELAGSATADTSLSIRLVHAVSVCHDGLASKSEQPEWVPLHAVSVHP